MPLYKYKAVDSKGGGAVDMLIEGDSQDDSLVKLRAKGFTPIRFMGEADAEGKSLFSMFSRKKKFDSCAFTNRLVPLLHAQIQLERALAIMGDTTEDEYSAEVARDIRRGLHEGKKFSVLIRDRSTLFPPIYANMVEAGEESGALTMVMDELNKFLNERKELRNFLITSSIYPIIILIVTGGLVLLLFTVFIPKFAVIFKSMGKTLPLPTQIMLGISNLFTGWWILAWVGLFLVIMIIIKKINEGGRAKEIWDENVLKIPIFGKLIQTIEVTRFVRTLSVLLQNYVPLLNSVEIAEKVIQNKTIKETLTGVTSELRAGTKLSSALGKSEFIPKTATQMMSIGEETGNVGEMLNETAIFYEGEIKNSIKKLLALFEPVVILLIAMVVLAVVLSIFMAIIEMEK
jgi:type II secretory pathway component PulF